jgi:hypothetical protein
MPLNSLSQSLARDFNVLRIEFFLLLAGLILMVFTLNPMVSGDGAIRFEIVQALLDGGKIQPILYSLVQPFLSMPIAYLVALSGQDVITYVAYFNFFVFLILGFTASTLLCRMYSCKLAVRFLLVLLAASMLPHHLQHYYGEVLTSMLMVTGFLLLFDKKRLLAIILIGLGIANTPVMIVPAAVTVLAMLVIRSIDRSYTFTLATAVIFATLIMALEMYLKFGLSKHPYLVSKGFQTVLPYSGNPGFSYPLFFGVMSILFSFGKGLLFFIPGLILLFHPVILEKLRLGKKESVIIVAFCISLILVYSKWWSWYGGSFWGPRFFLILIFPASMALAAFFDEKTYFTPTTSAIFSCVFILSAWVATNGYIFGQQDMNECWINNFQLEFLCWYVPEFSALWRPFVSRTLDFGGERLLYAIWQLVVVGYFLLKIISRDFKLSKIHNILN